MPRPADVVSTRPVSGVLRKEVFDLRIALPLRLAAGVLGLTIVAKHQSRQFRFAVTAGLSGPSSDGAAFLDAAIDRAFEGEVPTISEIVVHFRTGSVPIDCHGVTAKSLAPLLRQLAAGNLARERVLLDA